MVKRRKAELRVVKETFGKLDKQEAFQKAFAPYFDSQKSKRHIPDRVKNKSQKEL